MMYLIAIFVVVSVIVSVLVFNHFCSKADQKRLENLPGIYFCYEDGSPCLHFYYHKEDDKVWCYDFGRKFAQPSSYDSMDQLKKTLKPHKGGWKYKIVLMIFLVFWFSVFSCGISYAAPLEEGRYQQLALEYKPVIEKADAVRRIENVFNKHVSEHLVESKNLFLKAILLWQLIGFYREVYELEVAGKAPWIRRD